MYAYILPGHLHGQTEQRYNNPHPGQCEMVSSQPQSAETPIFSCPPQLQAVSSIRNP